MKKKKWITTFFSHMKRRLCEWNGFFLYVIWIVGKYLGCPDLSQSECNFFYLNHNMSGPSFCFLSAYLFV